jgi:GAF domain
MKNGTGAEPPKRGRGRPPNAQKTTGMIEREKSGGDQPSTVTISEEARSSGLLNDKDDEDELANGDGEQISEFSALLRSIFKHDRAEIARVAAELEVAENTIYRWMNGSSVPRHTHLRRLPDVLAEHRGSITNAINRSFPGVLNPLSQGIPEVPKDIYIRVLELVASIEEAGNRLWHTAQAVFDHALLHLDAERCGMAITYATLMLPREDDEIHSLHESIMRGTDPWPHTIESKTYLGSTTLAGTAASSQRTQVWNSEDGGNRLVIEIDKYEASACATPVMRGGKIAGVLIVSSTQPGFFKDSMACKAVDEYAHLLATALTDEDFYLYKKVNLRPMPDLEWQREQMKQEFVNKVLNVARKHRISRTEAEEQVKQEMELNFEKYGRIMSDSD